MTGPVQGELFRVGPPADPDAPPPTRGARMRALQAAAVSVGYHPLHRTTAQGLRLHPDAERTLAGGDGPRCGGCRFRVVADFGTAKRYPKCLWPDPERFPYPRRSSGPATDVRAGWPGCVDYQPGIDRVEPTQ